MGRGGVARCGDSGDSPLPSHPQVCPRARHDPKSEAFAPVRAARGEEEKPIPHVPALPVQPEGPPQLRGQRVWNRSPNPFSLPEPSGKGGGGRAGGNFGKSGQEEQGPASGPRVVAGFGIRGCRRDGAS